MTLRDYPLMSKRGVSNWPPVWVQTGRDADKTLKGEIGLLTKVSYGGSKSCFLGIEYDNHRYVGALLFDDNQFSWTICSFLEDHIGRSIKEIGGMDLSEVL